MLVKYGVPYAQAFEMEADERLAHIIVFGRLDGAEWDWGSRTFKER